MEKLIRCNSQVSTANIATKKMHAGKVSHVDLYAEYYVIENVPHMISGTVMNDICYGEKVFNELAEELMTTNARIPAPLSHPTSEDGGFMDANDPITFLGHNIGAFDTDWRVNGDKLVSNTYIPVDAIENPKEQGEWLAERVKNKKPIDRSTGLYLDIDTNKKGIGKDGEPYEGDVTRILELNHSALLDPELEPGAKNNVEGVGMFTNKMGDKVDIEDIDLAANASTPAMNLPLAPGDYQFDQEKAMARIKEYTGSTDKPSTTYRKFFLEFDQGDADNFESYNGLFADIIGGVPHAVDAALNDYVDDKYAQAYRTRFEELYSKSDSGIVEKVVNAVKSVFVNDSGKGYNKNRGEHPCKPTNNEDSKMDRDKLKKMMDNAGMDYTDDMSDDDMMNIISDGLKKNMGVKDNGGEGSKDYSVGNSKEELADLISTAVNAANKPLNDKITDLQDKLNANSKKEIDDLSGQVAGLNIGIDEDTAKSMTANALKSILAANGVTNFNAVNSHQSNSDFDLTKMEAID